MEGLSSKSKPQQQYTTIIAGLPPSTSSTLVSSQQQQLEEKADEILLVLSAPEVDLWKLRELALSEGGLVNDAIRKRVWPKLVGLHGLWGAQRGENQNDLFVLLSNRIPGNRSKHKIDHDDVSALRDDDDDDDEEYSSDRATLGRKASQQQTPGKINTMCPENAEAAIAAISATLGGSVTSSSVFTPQASRNSTSKMHADSSDEEDDDDGDMSVSSVFSIKSNSGDQDRMSSPASIHNGASSSSSQGGVGSTGKKNKFHVSAVVPKSADATQIELDVARCTWHLLTGSQRTQRLQMEHKRHKKVARVIKRKQRRLSNLINLTLVQSYARNTSGPARVNQSSPSVGNDRDRLRYYQGYHDVACIILSTLATSPSQTLRRQYQTEKRQQWAAGNSAVPEKETPAQAAATAKAMATMMGLDLSCAVLLQLSMAHFRDCMRANFIQLQTALRLTVFPLIAIIDPDVHAHLYTAEMEPFFALSWVITWFAHEIRDTNVVKRLFDCFMASHPLMPIYVAVAMVCHPVNRLEILETECDFALLHQTLTGLPKNSSMVGWKYRPGDGYVSDDEVQDDDAETVNTFGTFDTMQTGGTNSNTYGHMDAGEFLLVSAGLIDNPRGHHSTGSASSVCSTGMSSTLMEPPARVPFQELIDTAVQYMQRFPPRTLLSLANRYYGAEQVQTLLEQAREQAREPSPVLENITLLKGPPRWSVQATAKADWVLRNQLLLQEEIRREEELEAQKAAKHRRGGRKLRHRHSARSSKQSTTTGGHSTTASAATFVRKNSTVSVSSYDSDLQLMEEEIDVEVIQSVLKERRNTVAVIAAGCGPAGDDEDRQRRKRQKLFLYTAAAVVIVAIAVGVAIQYHRQQPQPPAIAAASNTTATTTEPITAVDSTTCSRDGNGEPVVETISRDAEEITSTLIQEPLPNPLPSESTFIQHPVEVNDVQPESRSPTPSPVSRSPRYIPYLKSVREAPSEKPTLPEQSILSLETTTRESSDTVGSSETTNAPALNEHVGSSGNETTVVDTVTATSPPRAIPKAESADIMEVQPHLTPFSPDPVQHGTPATSQEVQKLAQHVDVSSEVKTSHRAPGEISKIINDVYHAVVFEPEDIARTLSTYGNKEYADAVVADVPPLLGVSYVVHERAHQQFTKLGSLISDAYRLLDVEKEPVQVEPVVVETTKADDHAYWWQLGTSIPGAANAGLRSIGDRLGLTSTVQVETIVEVKESQAMSEYVPPNLPVWMLPFSSFQLRAQAEVPKLASLLSKFNRKFVQPVLAPRAKRLGRHVMRLMGRSWEQLSSTRAVRKIQVAWEEVASSSASRMVGQAFHGIYDSALVSKIFDVIRDRHCLWFPDECKHKLE